MSHQLPSTLSSSISGVIKPGACVNIPAREEVKTPIGVCGVIGLRQKYADKRLTLGATLIPAKWTGHPNIQLINPGDEDIDLREGDELVNVAYLQAYVG